MAVNKNIVSAAFDEQTMGSPRNYRLAGRGETLKDSVANQDWINSNDLMRREVAAQVAFGDHGKALIMFTDKFGVEGTLTIVTEDLGDGTPRTVTIVNARCTDVIMDAQHADVGAHIAMFEVRSSDGSANPVS